MKAFPATPLLIALITGLEAAGLDNRNQTVECSFLKVVDCFSGIAALGGNWTARYAETPKEMNATCLARKAFQSCMQVLPQTCNVQSYEMFGKLNDVIAFVDKLCKNQTLEYHKFLNSSVCYNRNQVRRQNCARGNAVKGTDAKSLCCHSLKLQKCLQDDMIGACSKNDTRFQNLVVNKYSLYTNTLCATYFKLCNGSSALSVAAALWLTLLVLFLSL